MDTQTLPDLQPEQSPALTNEYPTGSGPEQPQPEPKPDHARRGKIAHFPKEVRDRINQLLDDGFTAAQIIAQIGEHGAGLSDQNFTNWRKSGYLEWLKEQALFRRMRARHDLASGLLKASNDSTLHDASRQIVASQLWELFLEFDGATLVEAFQEHPELYPRLVSTLARFSEADLACARQKAQQAAATASLEKPQSGGAPRVISTGTLHSINTKLSLH